MATSGADVRNVGARRYERSAPAILVPAVTVGLLLALGGGLALAPGPLLDKLRVLTAGVCSLRPDHSFSVDGLTLPLCARDTGVYIGLLFALIWRQLSVADCAASRPTRWQLLFVAAATLALAVDGLDGLLSDLGLPALYEPSNGIRLATGLLWGGALGLFFALYSQVALGVRGLAPSRSARAWRWLLAPVTVGGYFAVLSGNAVGLYASALASVLGVVVGWMTVSRWAVAAVTPRLSGKDAWAVSAGIGTVALLVLSGLRAFLFPIP